MAIDEKRAPKDMALDDSTARLAPDVVQEQAQDYSGALQVEQQRVAIAADVFAPLIDMSENAFKYNQEVDEAGFQIGFNKEKLEDKEYVDSYNRLTESAITHDLFDKSVQMREQINLKTQWAREQGLSETEVMKQVLEDFRPEKLYPNSQMARENWEKHHFMPTYTNTLSNAMQKDIEADQAKAANELSTEESIMSADIANGGSPMSAIDKALRHTLLTRKNFSAADNQKIMNKLYDQAWKIYAQKIYANANPSNYAKAANALKSIIKNNSTFKTKVLDENGKPVIDPKTGKVQEVTLSIEPDTINSLLSSAGTLQDRARAGYGGGVSGVRGGSAAFNKYLEQVYGKDDSLYSATYAQNHTPDQINADFNRMYNDIASSTAYEPKTKAKMLNSLKEKQEAQIGLSQIMHNSNARKLKEWIKQTEGDLKEAAASGKFGNVLKAAAGSALSLGSAAANQFRAAKYLKEIGKAPHPNLLYISNSKIRSAENSVVEGLIGLRTSTNPNRDKKAIANSIVARQSYIQDFSTDRNASVGFSTNSIQRLTDHYNTLSLAEKTKFIADTAEIFKAAGHGDIVNSMITSDGNSQKQEREFLDSIQSEIYISNIKNGEVISTIRDDRSKGVSESELRKLISTPSEGNQYESKEIADFRSKIKDEIDNYSIGVEYQPSLMKAGETVYIHCRANGYSKDESTNMAKQVIQSNFVKIDSTYIKEASFVNNMCWGEGGYTEEKGMTLKAQIDRTGELIHYKLRSTGYEGRFFNKKDIEFKINSANSSIEIYINGSKSVMKDEQTGMEQTLSMPIIPESELPADKEEREKILGLQSQVVSEAALYFQITNEGIGGSAFKHFKQERGIKEDLDQEAYYKNINGMLSVLTSGEFMDYAQVLIQNENIYNNIDKAPEAYKTGFYIDPIRDKVIDLAYALSSYNNKVNTVQNIVLDKYIETGTYTYTDVLNTAKANGLQFDPVKSKSGTITFDVSGYKNPQILNDYGEISKQSQEQIQTMFSNKKAFSDAKISTYITKQGEPRLRVSFGTPDYSSDVDRIKKRALSVDPIATDAYQTQTKWLPRVPEKTINKIIGGLVTVNALNKSLNFDLLTPEQYQSYGLSGNQVKNPVLQARVLVNRYQQYLQTTGNKDTALWLLCGGKLQRKVYDSNGAIKESYTVDSDNILKMPIRNTANVQSYKIRGDKKVETRYNNIKRYRSFDDDVYYGEYVNR